VANLADLIDEIAGHLGKKVPGEDLGFVESEAIGSRIPRLIENINQRGLAYISNTDEIDDALFDPLARFLTAKICTHFGMTLANLPGFENEPMRSEVEMRVLGRQTKTNDVIRFQNF
jgi:hypothetical protein